MIRKARVNDVVHSFVWHLRSQEWPALIFEGDFIPPFSKEQADLSVFAEFAFTRQRNHVLAYRSVCLLAPWLRIFNHDELQYARHLLNTYYAAR